MSADPDSGESPDNNPDHSIGFGEQENPREQQRLVRHKAIDLLSRREHSRSELNRKLLQREFPREIIELVLDQLEQKNYLCDRRFAAQFAEQRLKKGYGEQAVRASLSGRGVASALAAEVISDLVQEEDVDWVENARQLLQKKFRNVPDSAMGDRLEQDKLRQRQARMLRQRGFSSNQSLRAIADFWSSAEQELD